MKNKSLNAEHLHKFLTDLKKRGEDLSHITIGYRFDYDSDVQECSSVEEDLYDNETNNRLTSIVFVTDNSEK